MFGVGKNVHKRGRLTLPRLDLFNSREKRVGIHTKYGQFPYNDVSHLLVQIGGNNTSQPFVNKRKVL